MGKALPPGWGTTKEQVSKVPMQWRWLTHTLSRSATLASFAILALCSLSEDAVALLDEPSSDVILVVTGNISEKNTADAAHLDRDMLLSLGTETLDTSNPFEEGTQHFVGVKISTLIEFLGASGNSLTVTALDGYSVEIPMDDVKNYPVILAMEWNGQAMSVRNKGPLWVVYPIDQFPKLNSEEYSSRSIWQISRIDVHK